MKWIRQNYHWVIAVLAFIEMTVFGGILNCASIFVIPITEALKITRGSYALAMIPFSIASTLSTMLSGVLFQKCGYKKSAIGGLLISVLSFILTATCQTLPEFCFSKILLGLGYGVCFTAGSVRIVKDWFFKHQGLVMGAVSMASGIGGSLITIILTNLIENYGWRSANIFLAVSCAVIALSYLILMRNRPEDIGLRPYGFGILTFKAKVRQTRDEHWPGLTFEEWIHRPLLYLMAIATLISCIALTLTSGIILPHLLDQGFLAEEAAKYQSINMLVLAIAKLLSGALADKIEPKPVMIVCLLCGVIGQGILGMVTDPVLYYVGTILCGVSLCASSIIIPLLTAPMFGYMASGSINSITLAMAALASVFTNPIANIAFDYFGSYAPVFKGAAVTNGALIIVYLLLFVISKKEKIRSMTKLET